MSKLHEIMRLAAADKAFCFGFALELALDLVRG